jgi:hypothetical protein
MGTDRSETVAPGIRFKANGYEARISTPAGNRSKRFKKQTPISFIQQWQHETKHSMMTRNSPVPMRLAPAVEMGETGFCYVYFFRSGDVIKIGQSSNPERRRAMLQGNHPWPIETLVAFPAHRDIERAFHRHFDHLRTNGEWFKADPSILEMVEQLRLGLNPIALLFRGSPPQETNQQAELYP